jgi:hypothetical protein
MTMALRKRRFLRVIMAAAVLLGVFWVGANLQPRRFARGGVRETTPKQHFLAGSERSLPILTEISATLKQIDARLARIEKTIDDAAEK